jgi:malonate transporter and related proteins
MSNVIGLVLPFFGMILLGYVVARITRQPLEALGWMNTFVIYVALPALFFQLLAKTPIERLTELGYIFGAVLATYIVFAIMFAGSVLTSRGEIAESTIKGLAAAYGNIGYMGPGLALLAFGEEAAVPVALIFCFDNIFLFSIVPMLMAVFGATRRPLWPTVWHVAKQIAFHPLIVASWLGALAAAVHFNPPVAVDRTLEFLQNAAAPVALFALGVTVALRPFERVPWEVPGVVAVKLLLHPAMAFGLLMLLGPFDPQWIATALLMASLPPALNAFIIARQYDTWVEAASTAVLLGTLVSVVTLTFMMWALKTGQISF